eukprot:g10652.t1
MKREDALVRAQLAQSQGKPSVTRRSLSYAASSSSSSSSASWSSSSILASPSTAVAAAPPAGPSLAPSSSASSSQGMRPPMIAECSVTAATGAYLRRSLQNAPATPIPALPTSLTSRQACRSTPVRERKSSVGPASSPCSRPAPEPPTPDRHIQPVPDLLRHQKTHMQMPMIPRAPISALSEKALVLHSSFPIIQVSPTSVPPWWVTIMLLLSSLRCCVLNRRACNASRWIWDIAKIEAEEEVGAWVRSLPLSKLGLCPLIPSLLFCLSWRVGMSGGMTSLSG